jgi:hypothetical protein
VHGAPELAAFDQRHRLRLQRRGAPARLPARHPRANPSARRHPGNRDDLFSVTSLKHYPYVANSAFHKPKHLYSWKTLLRCAKNWPAIAAALRANVDVALTLYRNGSWAGIGDP